MRELLAEALTWAERGKSRYAREDLHLAASLARSADDLDAVVSAMQSVLRCTPANKSGRLQTLLQQTEKRRDAAARRAVRDRLMTRTIRLLKLLLHNDGAVQTAEIQPLLSLVSTSSLPWAKAVEEAVDEADRAWGEVVVKGFARGQEAAATLALAPLVDHHAKLVRELKKAAMHLVEVGAEVVGVREDAVPLVAYGLLAGVLPAGPRAENDELEDRLIDAMLRVADTSAKLPPEQRLVFLAYYRLAFLLGIAEGYAERLSLSRLTLS